MSSGRLKTVGVKQPQGSVYYACCSTARVIVRVLKASNEEDLAVLMASNELI